MIFTPIVLLYPVIHVGAGFMSIGLSPKTLYFAIRLLMTLFVDHKRLFNLAKLNNWNSIIVLSQISTTIESEQE
jgi:hypothetical protein